MASLLNIGLAVCCGGLLVWNLRLMHQARVDQIAIDTLAQAVIRTCDSDFYTVDDLGEPLDLIEPNPKAIH